MGLPSIQDDTTISGMEIEAQDQVPPDGALQREFSVVAINPSVSRERTSDKSPGGAIRRLLGIQGKNTSLEHSYLQVLQMSNMLKYGMDEDTAGKYVHELQSKSAKTNVTILGHVLLHMEAV